MTRPSFDGSRRRSNMPSANHSAIDSPGCCLWMTHALRGPLPILTRSIVRPSSVSPTGRDVRMWGTRHRHREWHRTYALDCCNRRCNALGNEVAVTLVRVGRKVGVVDLIESDKKGKGNRHAVSLSLMRLGLLSLFLSLSLSLSHTHTHSLAHAMATQFCPPRLLSSHTP